MKNFLGILFVAGLIVGTIVLLSRLTGPKISNELSPEEMAVFLREQTGPVQIGELADGTEPNIVSTMAAERGHTQSDIDAIRQKLAERFDLKWEEVKITLGADSTSKFATGLVNVGEGEKGGIYFAAKTEKGWEIAHDGRGILECTRADNYEFPAGLIPRCFDLETGLNVDR